MIGFGESEDPVPEQVFHTRYKVFAGPCENCGCAGRKLFVSGNFLALVCDECHSELHTSISAADLPEVTYVYWCNASKFASDEVKLSSEDEKQIADLVNKIADEYETPHWAVMIVGGRCARSDVCVNFSCPYLKKSQ